MELNIFVFFKSLLVVKFIVDLNREQRKYLVSDKISILSVLISENFVNAVMVTVLRKQCHIIC